MFTRQIDHLPPADVLAEIKDQLGGRDKNGKQDSLRGRQEFPNPEKAFAIDRQETGVVVVDSTAC